MMKHYYVDFGTITIDEETKNKIETDKDYLKKWISENVEIDTIIEEKQPLTLGTMLEYKGV